MSSAPKKKRRKKKVNENKLYIYQINKPIIATNYSIYLLLFIFGPTANRN